MADGEGAQKDGREEDQAVKLYCGGKVMFIEYRCSCAILVPNVCVCACVCVHVCVLLVGGLCVCPENVSICQLQCD